jgi:DNA-binding transcriptional LysR family regulator
MDIQSIQAFLAVSESGSFSRAADALFLTQPAVSKRIQVMEQALDTQLFDRVGKSVRLTEAGRALLPSCKRIIEEIEESRRIISNLRLTTSGVLRLATSHHVGLHRLPPVLRDYTGSYPEVELKLAFMESEQAFQQIINGDIELAIVTLPNEKDERLEMIPIWHDALCPVVSRRHKLASADRVTVKSLLQQPAILPSPGTYTRHLIDKALGIDESVPILLETHYLETIKAMVQAGLGWSMLPLSMLDKSLVELDIRRGRATRQLGAVLHSMRTQSNAANAMISLLKRYSDQAQNA